jgi:hypothetical protein
MSLEKDIHEIKKIIESTGAVCSECGSPVSEEEISSGMSKCCKADVQDEGDYLNIHEPLDEKGVEVAEPDTEIVPETIPMEPEKKPNRPSTPIRPTPGIQPHPKGLNTDIELFLKKRNLSIGEKIEEKLKQCKKCGGDADIKNIDGDWVAQCKQCDNEFHGCDIKKWTTQKWNKLNEATPLKGVHPEKMEWIETGDEQLNQILPKLSDKEQSYLKTIASEAYAETVARVEEFTGIKVQQSNLPSLAYLLMETLEQVKSIEKTNKRNLEEMALDLVFSIPEFKIVEEAYLNDELGFDIKIDSGELGKLKTAEKEDESELSSEEELNLDLAYTLKDETDEDLRRKFANLLTTGGSINKLYLFNMANDRLTRINPNLPIYYGILASVAQIGYWVTPFGIEQAALESEVTSAGSEEVIPKGDKYIIKVRGSTFPYLVHELVKGIYEYLSLDPSQQIAMQKDTVEDETKDIISGPGIYKAVTSYIPADKQELLPIVQKKLTSLSPEDIRHVISKDYQGQEIMKDLIRSAETELGKYRKDKEEYNK